MNKITRLLFACVWVVALLPGCGRDNKPDDPAPVVVTTGPLTGTVKVQDEAGPPTAPGCW